MKRKHLSLAIGCVLLSSMPLAWAQDAAPAPSPLSRGEGAAGGAG